MGNTSVVCGARAEILREEDIPGTHIYTSSPSTQQQEEDGNIAEEEDDSDIADTTIEELRLLVPNVELSTGSTPAHIPGNAPSTFAQTLITRIRSLLYSAHLVRPSDLRILYTPSSTQSSDIDDTPPEPQLKGYWTLYLDVFFISIDGNAFDASWMAILAALRDVMLPKAYFDEEYEGILCSDDLAEARRLRLRGLPVSSTFAVFEGKKEDGVVRDDEEGQDNFVLSDPDAFEEEVCKESVCVVVDVGSGKRGTRDALIRKIEKSGGGVVNRDLMKDLVKRAIDRWEEVEGVLSGRS